MTAIDIPAGWGKDEVRWLACCGMAGRAAGLPHTRRRFASTPLRSLFPAPPPTHPLTHRPTPSLQSRVGAADHMALTTGSRTAAEFLNNVVRPMLAMEGDKLPVR